MTAVHKKQDIERRLKAVIDCPSEKFRDLLIAGGFNLQRDLRYRNLSGMSFAGDDLRGMDFTGADLSNCDFTYSVIAGANFDRAILGYASTDPSSSTGIKSTKTVTDLSKAIDYKDYKDKWVATKSEGHEDMPEWAIFKDSPFMPRLVAYPALHGVQFAMSPLVTVIEEDLRSRTHDQENRYGFTFFSEAKKKCNEYNDGSSYDYELPTVSEMQYAMSLGALPSHDASAVFANSATSDEWCRSDCDDSKAIIRTDRFDVRSPASSVTQPIRLCFRVRRKLLLGAAPKIELSVW